MVSTGLFSGGEIHGFFGGGAEKIGGISGNVDSG
jgi:hypothetical protein